MSRKIRVDHNSYPQQPIILIKNNFFQLVWWGAFQNAPPKLVGKPIALKLRWVLPYR